MKLPNIAKAAGLGAAVLLVSAGVASAAVATASVNVRTGPGTGYRVIDTLRPGQQVAIVDQAGGWCAIRQSGPNGWVSCAYLGNSVRYPVYRSNPSISLSFGFRVRPDRPHRPPRHDWWDDHNHGDWDGSRSGGSFGLSLMN